jgi:hypothetical protein
VAKVELVTSDSRVEVQLADNLRTRRSGIPPSSPVANGEPYWDTYNASAYCNSDEMFTDCATATPAVASSTTELPNRILMFDGLVSEQTARRKVTSYDMNV